MLLSLQLIRRDATARRVLDDLRRLSTERKRDLLELARKWLNASEWKTFQIKAQPFLTPEVKITHVVLKLPEAGAKVVQLKARKTFQDMI